MIYNSALFLAEWQSGHAADCKSVHAGSIPTSASRNFIWNLSKIHLYKELEPLIEIYLKEF